MLVRTLDAQDAAAFLSLRLCGLKECPEAFTSSYEEEESSEISTIGTRLQSSADQAVFGAFEGATLVGVAGIQREPLRKLAHKALLWGVYVAPEARAHGVATRLLRAALAHAATVLGVRQINLGVNPANLPAVALYRQLGFTEFGRERDFLLVDGTFHDECHMVCRLGVE